jgi:hypothetical protein
LSATACRRSSRATSAKDGRPHEAVETEAISQRVLLDILRAGLEQLLPEPRARAASSAGSSGCCALRVLEPTARSASAQGTSSERPIDARIAAGEAAPERHLVLECRTFAHELAVTVPCCNARQDAFHSSSCSKIAFQEAIT